MILQRLKFQPVAGQGSPAGGQQRPRKGTTNVSVYSCVISQACIQENAVIEAMCMNASIIPLKVFLNTGLVHLPWRLTGPSTGVEALK